MERDPLGGRLIPLIFLAACSTASAVEVLPQQAQIQAPATQSRQSSVQPVWTSMRRPQKPAAEVQLTDEDRQAIADYNRNHSSDKPLKVGKVKQVDLQVDLQPLDLAAMTDETYSYAAGNVRRANGYVTWAARFEAKSVYAMRFHIRQRTLSPGGTLSFYDDAGNLLASYGDSAEDVWTGTLSAPSIYIMLQAPEGETVDASAVIDAAVLFDETSQAFCPTNAPCIEDGSCHTAAEWPEIDKARKAVALINFVEDGWSYMCSGGLLADTAPDTSIPYFLTANHCVNNPSAASSVEAWFDYKTAFCGSGAPPIQPGTASTLGATLLQHSAVDDHSLLLLDEPPPADAWYLGWTDTPVANSDGAVLFRLSHPQGAPQAFSAHKIDSKVSPTDYCGTTTLPRGRFVFSRNVMGATEGGSSGAPLIQSNGQVVGQLYGICGYNIEDVCDSHSNVTVDGAFASYYNDVAKWLSPDPEQLPLTVQKLGTGEGRIQASTSTATSAAEALGTATPMLLGGTPVEQSEWPWQAALKISTWRINGSWTCGGSVIAPNWILTAAHCIVDTVDARYSTISPSNIEVRTGSTHFEYGGQASGVKRIVKHPEFDPITLDHDIALLELKGPVYVDPVRPVTWPRESSLACTGTLGSVTGWTPTDVCGHTDTLLSKVDATIVDPDTCRSAYGADTITDNMLCTSSAADSTQDCQSDDGSPLVVDNGRGGYAQAGIVSWGNGCDSPSSPTVYTRLANHVEWMEYVTGEDLSSEVGPGVIDCGSTCSAQFAKDTLITLSAEPTPGSEFVGWEGACMGTESTCEITMTHALNVKAIFGSTQATTLSCSTGSL